MTLLGWEKILATWFLTEYAWSHHTFDFLLDINPLSSKLCCSHDIPTKQLQLIRATLHNLLWSIFEIGLTRWCALFFSLSFLPSFSLVVVIVMFLFLQKGLRTADTHVIYVQFVNRLSVSYPKCVNVWTARNNTEKSETAKSDSKMPLQLASVSTWQYIWFTNK